MSFKTISILHRCRYSMDHSATFCHRSYTCILHNIYSSIQATFCDKFSMFLRFCNSFLGICIELALCLFVPTDSVGEYILTTCSLNPLTFRYIPIVRGSLKFGLFISICLSTFKILTPTSHFFFSWFSFFSFYIFSCSHTSEIHIFQRYPVE